LNEELEWMELPDKRASNIRISRPDNINEPYEREEQWLFGNSREINLHDKSSK